MKKVNLTLVLALALVIPLTPGSAPPLSAIGIACWTCDAAHTNCVWDADDWYWIEIARCDELSSPQSEICRELVNEIGDLDIEICDLGREICLATCDPFAY